MSFLKWGFDDPAKVETILERKPPRNDKEVQVFLGFANFYQKFVKGYSKVTEPLPRLKDTKFDWSDKAQHAFETLKSAFTSAPILTHFDPQ